MRKRFSIILFGVGLSVLSVLSAQSKESSGIDLTRDTRAAMEQAREQAKTMTIPENTHNKEGIRAAEKTNALYRSPEFQQKIADEIRKQEDFFIPEGRKIKKKTDVKGVLAENEKVYLFLSSSIPEASFQGYMAALEGVVEIEPVMFGMVGGMDKKFKKERTKWFSKVLKKDTTCEKTPEKSCELIKPNITINPHLFDQYTITEVPALIYVRGNEIFEIQGDVGINDLLEKVNREARSPGIKRLIARISGSR